MLFIDCDNGLGSSHGDVDDAFALWALLVSGAPIAGISPAKGNVDCDESYDNCRRLLELTGRNDIPLLPLHLRAESDRPFVVGKFLRNHRDIRRILALAPLSNFTEIAQRPQDFDHIQEFIVVGANSESRGFLPPFWPFEFNLTKDRWAAYSVLSSGLPVTFIPLNQARRLTLPFSEMEALTGAFGEFVRNNGARWWKRARRLYGKKEVPIWDLVAAMAVLHPEKFEFSKQEFQVEESGRVRFGIGHLEAKILKGFDPANVWQDFSALNEKSRLPIVESGPSKGISN